MSSTCSIPIHTCSLLHDLCESVLPLAQPRNRSLVLLQNWIFRHLLRSPWRFPFVGFFVCFCMSWFYHWLNQEIVAWFYFRIECSKANFTRLRSSSLSDHVDTPPYRRVATSRYRRIDCPLWTELGIVLPKFIVRVHFLFYSKPNGVMPKFGCVDVDLYLKSR